ncbi:GAF domain-containing protein [Sphingomonas sabuli]|uniref:GAF domain-containing protein n=1 Tax=Sphingomonas sabuli TaxID=2764186 RepID=A0A7G9L4Y0_9SPHN|nr:GAF domain-containing protein [Sphingomonas sabuli]QNM83679.1 GAF domain-containing protein [Sphingomonas sabuli]
MSDSDDRYRRLERQLARERAARFEAEAIAEKGLRDLYESRQRLELLQRITEGANAVSRMRVALDFALGEICSQMGWDFANAYLASHDQTRVEACDLWRTPDKSGIEPFIEASRRIAFASGVGVPGIVLATKTAYWIDDARIDGKFKRRALAAKCGFVTACAFPVMAGDEVIAVMEFLSRRTLHRDESLIALMEQIGKQLAGLSNASATRC